MPNPQVPQGGSLAFALGTPDYGGGEVWRITDSAMTLLATDSVPNGWSASFSSPNVTVGAPVGATIAVGYHVYYDVGGGSYETAEFDVIASGGGGTGGVGDPVNITRGSTGSVTPDTANSIAYDWLIEYPASTGLAPNYYPGNTGEWNVTGSGTVDVFVPAGTPKANGYFVTIGGLKGEFNVLARYRTFRPGTVGNLMPRRRVLP